MSTKAKKSVKVAKKSEAIDDLLVKTADDSKLAEDVPKVEVPTVKKTKKPTKKEEDADPVEEAEKPVEVVVVQQTSAESKKEKADPKGEDGDERQHRAERSDDEIVSRPTFRPTRGRGAVYRGRGNRGRGGNQDANGRPERKENSEHRPRGRGGFRGRGRSADGESRGPRVPYTDYSLKTYSENAFDHYVAQNRKTDIEHFVIKLSDMTGHPCYAHPQEDEITFGQCYSVNGKKGGFVPLIHGRRYAISLRSSDPNRKIVFTKSCAVGKEGFSWLPFVGANQTLEFNVTPAFPRYFYYQDSTERFLGGPLIVTRNFSHENKGDKHKGHGHQGKPKSSKRESDNGSDSDSDEHSGTGTAYDD
jgi:hypothetical protein